MKRFIITKSLNETPKARQKHGRIEVFLDMQERPINRGDVAADFEWRRSHDEPLTKARRTELLWTVLRDLKLDKKVAPESLSIRYDRYCGCRSCPCSPGYTVRIKDHLTRKSVWVTQL